MIDQFLANANNWVQFDLNFKRGIKDSSLYSHEITNATNLVHTSQEFQLTSGSFDIPSLFKHAPPIPHSGGQSYHKWAVILELNQLTNLTIEAVNNSKGFQWVLEPTSSDVTVGGTTESDIPINWDGIMLFQHQGPDTGGFLYTRDKKVNFSIPHGVVFGGMRISGTAHFSRIRILKGEVSPSIVPNIEITL